MFMSLLKEVQSRYMVKHELNKYLNDKISVVKIIFIPKILYFIINNGIKRLHIINKMCNSFGI